jgi:hypothetical protein
LNHSTTVTRLAEVASLDPQDKPPSFERVGWIAGASAQGRPLVDFAGNTAGPLEAESTVDATPRDLEAAARRRQPVVLLFNGDDLQSPIVRGFIVQTPPAADLPTLTEANPPALPEVAQVDGKRVCIEGKDEIVLSCGEASITLRRNGKIILRGTYLESHSEGTNRIKGGAVQVN